MKYIAVKWLPLLIIVLLMLSCGEEGTPPEGPSLVISPDSVYIEVSSSQQFDAEYEGEVPPVVWLVDGKVAGDPSIGMITPDGVFIAPSDVPAGGKVTISARMLADTSVTGSATVFILKEEETAFIEVTPQADTLGVGESTKFEATPYGCTPDSIVWSVEVVQGSPLTIGTIHDNGTYVAPEVPDGSFSLMVIARGMGCDDKAGIARVEVMFPKEFKVELENFTRSYDRQDGTKITVAPCTGASGKKAVDGLDKMGEWIEIPMSVPADSYYEVKLRYSAPKSPIVTVGLSLINCGKQEPTPQAEIKIIYGRGVG